MKVLAWMNVIVWLMWIPLQAAQPAVGPAQEADAYRGVAAAIPLGSRVRVETREGRRLTATLIGVTADAVIVKKEGRLPEPALTVPFAELVRLQRDERGLNLAQAVGIGLAAGAGAVLTLFSLAFALAH